MKNGNRASTSSEPSWKWLWKINIPPKVKIFVWRLIHGLLPMGIALLKRKIHIDGICNKCGEDVETIEHVFRDCIWNHLFWYSSYLRIDITEEDVRSGMMMWIHKQKHLFSREGFTLFLMFL